MQTLKAFIFSFYNLVFIGIAVLFVVIFSTLTEKNWQSLLDDEKQKLLDVNTNIAAKSSDFMLQQASTIALLGDYMLEYGGLDNLDKIRSLMDAYLDKNPVLFGYAIINVEGDITYASVENINRSDINLLKIEYSRPSFERTLASRNMVLGRTYYVPELDKTILPMRLAIRNDLGQPQFVLALVLDIHGDYSPWEIESMDESINVIVVSPFLHYQNYFTYYLKPHDLFGAEKGKEYSDYLPSAFTDNANENSLKYSGLSLLDIEKGEGHSIYINSTAGMDPALVIVSYVENFDYFVANRKTIPNIYQQHRTYEIYVGLTCTFITLLFLSFLYFIFFNHQRQNALLEYQSVHDRLTELPNRHYLENIRKMPMLNVGVIFIDLDNFKFINDTFGHAIGDQLLVCIAQRLRKSAGNSEVIRLSGDEFIVITRARTEQQMISIAEDILREVSKVIIIREINMNVTASVGLALSRLSSENLESVIHQADLAMYEAKAKKNAYVFYSEQMEALKSEHAELEKDLREALNSEHAIFLNYQPQIDFAKHEIVGCEALARWKHPTKGNIPPDTFIALAEKTGLINKLGELVMKMALDDLADIKSPDATFTMAINVSAHQLIYGNFVETLLDYCKQKELDTRQVKLEITESMLIEDFELVEHKLNLAIKEGLGVSLDDFGTGYSSLSVLRKLPINEIKIDRSFIMDILIDEQDKALIQSIIGIGKTLDLSVVAEGVESKEQAEALLNESCSILQGYLFAKPMGINELKGFIAKHQQTSKVQELGNFEFQI